MNDDTRRLVAGLMEATGLAPSDEELAALCEQYLSLRRGLDSIDAVPATSDYGVLARPEQAAWTRDAQ